MNVLIYVFVFQLKIKCLGSGIEPVRIPILKSDDSGSRGKFIFFSFFKQKMTKDIFFYNNMTSQLI